MTATWVRMGEEMNVSKDVLMRQKLGVDEKRKESREHFHKWMEKNMSAHSYWPKASHSYLLCLTKVPKNEKRNGKTKDQSEGALDKRDGDMDVRAGKENHSGTKEEVRHGDWRLGWKDMTAPAADGRGEHKQKKQWNQVKGAGSSTYQVIAHISLHPIFPPTIESCGKWIETVWDGKSI